MQEHGKLASSLVILIGLLRPADPSVGPSPLPAISTEEFEGRKGREFLEIVIKCIVKLTKTMADHIREMDLDFLLLGIHEYLEEVGLEEIRRRSGLVDKPLRMVKTVLHQACKLVGPSIKGRLSLVPINHHPPPSSSPTSTSTCRPSRKTTRWRRTYPPPHPSHTKPPCRPTSG